MAFFCPGSSSSGKSGKSGKKNSKSKMNKTGPFPLDVEKHPIRIHTDPHPRMVIVQDFVPYNHRELHVLRGDIVELLGGERDWVYARTEGGEKGFIPRSHCMALSADEVPSKTDFEATLPSNGRSHSTPVAPFGEPPPPSYGDTPPRSYGEIPPYSYGEAPPLSSPVTLADRLKKNQNSPVPHIALFRNSSNGSIDDGILRKDRSKSRGSWHSQSDGLSSDGKVHDRGDDLHTYQNGRVFVSSEVEGMHFRTRPLPSLPRESPKPSEGDSHYHTILRDNSASPEPQVGQHGREITPYADPHVLRGGRPQSPIILNSIARRRHGSVNDTRLKKITPEGSTAALMMYRTSSDSLKAFGQSTAKGRLSDPQSPLPDSSQPECSKFRKVVWGVYEVVNSFVGIDENEISISQGERVSLLNQDDPNWFWVVRMGNAEEGFVPKSCLREHISTQSEAEYDQIIPRTKSSPVPQRVLNHNSRSKSLPRNAGTKCISSSSLDDKKKMASLSRGGKLVRNSSPAAPVFDWSQGHHMTEASTNGESSLQASAIAMATEHPLHHTAKRGKSLDKYKRHSTDDNLLNKASNLGLGNKSEDSGIIMVDYDDGGTLV